MRQVYCSFDNCFIYLCYSYLVIDDLHFYGLLFMCCIISAYKWRIDHCPFLTDSYNISFSIAYLSEYWSLLMLKLVLVFQIASLP